MSQKKITPTDHRITMEEFHKNPSASESQNTESSDVPQLLISNSDQVHALVHEMAVENDRNLTIEVGRALRHKKRVSHVLDQFSSLSHLSLDVLKAMTIAFLDKGAFRLLEKGWLVRALKEIPEQAPAMFEVAVHSVIEDVQKVSSEEQMETACRRAEKLAAVIERCMDLTDELADANPKHFSLAASAGLYRMYGYFQEFCVTDYESAELHYRDAVALNDPRAHMLLGMLCRKTGRHEEGTALIRHGWEKLRSQECLAALMQDDFEAGKIGDASEKWGLLQSMKVDVPPKTSMMEEYVFPRDMYLLQMESRYGENLYNPEIRERIYQGINEAYAQAPGTSSEAMVFRLPLLQLGAIELANFDVSKKYLESILLLLKEGAEGRKLLQKHFELFSSDLSRTWHVVQRNVEASRIDDADMSDEEGFVSTLHRHLTSAVKTYCFPEALELIEIMGEIGKFLQDEDIISEAAVLTEELVKMQARITNAGPHFEKFYQGLRQAATDAFGCQENRDIVTSQFVLSGGVENADEGLVQLTYMMVTAILSWLNQKAIYRHLGKLSANRFDSAALKAMGMLLFSEGYLEDSLYYFSQADLQDVEVLVGFVNSALNSHKPLRLAWEGLARRPDSQGKVVDIRPIIKRLYKAAKESREALGGYLTLLGEADILYGDTDQGIARLRAAVVYGDLQAVKRLAEHQFYVLGSAQGALPLFEEFFRKSGDPQTLIDLARTSLAMGDREKAQEYLQKFPRSDTEEAVLAWLQFFMDGSHEERIQGVTLLSITPLSLRREIQPSIKKSYDTFISKRIEELNAASTLTAQEIDELLFLYRSRISLHPENINSAIDYFETFRYLLIRLGKRAEAPILSFLLSFGDSPVEEQVMTHTSEDHVGKVIPTLDAALQIEGRRVFEEVGTNPEGYLVSDSIGHMFRDWLANRELSESWYVITRSIMKDDPAKKSEHYLWMGRQVVPGKLH